MRQEEKSGKLQQEILVEDDRTGMSVETLSRAFLDNLAYTQGRFLRLATRWDKYMALAYTIRDRLVQRWIRTVEACFEKHVKLATYLSAEYLLGPQLGKNLMNLGITESVREALAIHGIELEWLLEAEEEPGLGNGGLGRLAACFLDSLATMQVPAIGYGIRYEFGIFDQAIQNGWQEEITDKWLQFGNPWEIPKNWSYNVGFGGYTQTVPDGNGGFRVDWRPEHEVRGIAYDTPILGYGGNLCNTLRLWKAEACDSFDFDAFNHGDYYRAVEEKVTTENLTKILYPNDEPAAGKKLRLAQQVFFASCSLQDMIRIHLLAHRNLDDFHEKFAVQLNDTHPSIAVPELMRLLVDVHRMDWDTAWNVTRQSFAYTNHTLMPEALETWPLTLFGKVLPRHLEIVYEINRRFLGQVAEVFSEDGDRARRLSLIDEREPRSVRMAHLAVVGSHAVNGVAELHTDLMKRSIFRDFHDMMPDMFSNKTNGVTPRRFLLMINPELASLISECVGTGWPTDLEKLRGLEDYVDDDEFRARWHNIKRANKRRLAQFMNQQTGASSDPDSLFDVHVKRIHEYKRQHLNALHIVALYRALKQNPDMDIVPRTFIFAGKAAPGYDMAKLMIRFVTAVGDLVNNVDTPGRGRVRTDLHGRNRSKRYRQHETRIQRRADHRNPRRRQYRDPRRCRRRQFLPLRDDSRRGPQAETGRLQPPKLLRPGRAARRCARFRRIRRPSGRILRDLPSAYRPSPRRRSVHGSRRLPVVCRLPDEGRRAVSRPRRLDTHVHTQCRTYGALFFRPRHT
jgi:starch phosphorylase